MESFQKIPRGYLPTKIFSACHGLVAIPRKFSLDAVLVACEQRVAPYTFPNEAARRSICRSMLRKNALSHQDLNKNDDMTGEWMCEWEWRRRIATTQLCAARILWTARKKSERRKWNWMSVSSGFGDLWINLTRANPSFRDSLLKVCNDWRRRSLVASALFASQLSTPSLEERRWRARKMICGGPRLLRPEAMGGVECKQNVISNLCVQWE